MIPIKLTLEGIYSYQKRQTIDFTELTNAGLFGIFGAVASGKSTILEALCFALYGESDRMNLVNRAYNMMNLKSNRMYIEFDFSNFKNKVYRVVREFRRNSNQFDKVLPYDTTFYEWKNDDWLPLDHTNAEVIIGLSCENFKRTIIIPQGKFKEFIELGGKDRTSMMKEIFNLHHFDLYNNVRTLYNINEDKLNTLLGKLSGYEDVSEEIIADKLKYYSEQNSLFNEHSEEHKQLAEAYERLKQQSADFNKLQEQQVKLASEETNKKLIDEREQSLKLYVTTHEQFDEILRIKEQLSQKLNKENSLFEENRKELTQNLEREKTIIEEITIRKPFIDAIEFEKEKIVDLELISQVLINKNAIKEGEENTIKGRNYVKELTKSKDDLIKTINETEVEIEEKKNKLIDTKILTSIELWFATHKAFSNQFVDKQAKLNSINKEILAIEVKFQEWNYSKKSWNETIEKQIEVLSNQLNDANREKNQLEVKQQIAHFANEIHEGAACPLCGSLEHPEVIETEDVSIDIEDNQAKLKRLEQELKLLTVTHSKLIQLQASDNSLLKNREVVESELKRLQEEEKQHLSMFLWKDFSSNDENAFNQKKTVNDELIHRIDQLEKNQKLSRSALDNINIKLSRAAERLEEIERENRENEVLITSNTNKINHLLLKDYEHQTSEAVNSKITERKQHIKKEHDIYTDLERQNNELLRTISAQTATKVSIENYITQLTQEQEGNDAIINRRLVENSFESLNEIVQLLRNKINVDAERKHIEDFRINYTRLKQSVEELKERLEGKSFSLKEFEVEIGKFESSEKAINELRVQVATLNHDLERLEKKFAEKKELLIEKGNLEMRKGNITILSRLFTGSGFVNYVSSIYLRNLCEIANKRFHRLTKNQLSLQVNDKNEFEIIDYLNDGRTRSVRTLSGGQNFQVSLSLALALAENVQSMTNSDKNFFFIDEGFGTQDAESVNIVFETLSNLQKENRIVGIISHVEELQERIPKSLFIKKDLEKGSLIEMMR